MAIINIERVQQIKKYMVEMPFQGTLNLEVFAEDEETAMKLFEEEINKLSADEVLNNAQWGKCEIYKTN
jgi:CTP-dependent riboflavin kinase